MFLKIFNCYNIYWPDYRSCFYFKAHLNTFVHFTIEEQLGVSQFYIAFIVFLPILISFKSILEKKQLILHTILLCISVGVLFLLGNKTTLFFLFCFMDIFYHIVVFKTKTKERLFFDDNWMCLFVCSNANPNFKR